MSSNTTELWLPLKKPIEPPVDSLNCEGEKLSGGRWEVGGRRWEVGSGVAELTVACTANLSPRKARDKYEKCTSCSDKRVLFAWNRRLPPPPPPPPPLRLALAPPPFPSSYSSPFVLSPDSPLSKPSTPAAR